MPTASDPDGFLERQYDRSLDDIVRGLREAADRIAQIGRPSTSGRSTTPYGDAAGQVSSALLNALPNLPLGLLFSSAATVDRVASLEAAVAGATSTTERDPLAPPPTHPRCGSDSDRASVGLPGHCERCAEVGHVKAHPDLGCGDVGCDVGHGPGEEGD